jgi:hypothetical protein
MADVTGAMSWWGVGGGTPSTKITTVKKVMLMELGRPKRDHCHSRSENANNEAQEEDLAREHEAEEEEIKLAPGWPCPS